MGAGPVSGQQSLPLLHGWDGPWQGLRVLVTGFGITGFSAADTLAELGAHVVVVDGQESSKKLDDAATLRAMWDDRVVFRFGDNHTERLKHFDDERGADELPDLVVTSPGWRPDSPIMQAAAAENVPIWSDIQLARRLGARPGAHEPAWLVLTGTNGKTTTVKMLEAMLVADGRRAVACGNIGMPILDAIRDPDGYQALAVELSSFQLHYTEPLTPVTSAVLNVAEDHMDWHGGLEAYAADKAKIYESTTVACIYNAQDSVTEKMVAAADVVEGARAIGFTTDSPDVSMLGLVDDILVDRAFLKDRRHQALELATRADFGTLAPQHLVANALAAAALARSVDVAPESIQQAIRAYQPDDHRIQPVAKADDVLWVNDTKATNPHAAAASLSSFTDVVWIAGGLSKGVDYDRLVQQVASRLRHVILIGSDSTQLRSSLERHAPKVPVSEVPGGDDGETVMRSAVASADRYAQPGQAVVLAPAAASMDQFASYVARGEQFIAAVTALMRDKGFPTQ